MKLNVFRKVKKLKYKILLPILAGVGLLYFLAVGYFIQKIYTIRLDDTKRYVESLSIQNANKISNEMVRYYNISETMARFLEDMNLRDSLLTQRIDRGAVYNVLDNNPDFHAVWLSRQFSSYKPGWNKPHGRSRVTAYFSEETGEVATIMAYLEKEQESALYKNIREGNRDIIVEPYVDAVGDIDSVWMTSVAAPIKRNGEFIGLAGIDVSLNRISELVYRTENYMGSKAFLVSAQGNYIAHYNSELRGNKIDNLKSDELDLYARVALGRNFSGSVIDSGKEEYFVAFSPVEMSTGQSPWMLGVSVPLSGINRQARQAVVQAIFIGIGSLLFMVLLVFRITSYITKPIKEASRFAEKIAKGNLMAELQIEGKDEIANLGNYLNDMREKFRSIIDQVQKMSVTLSDSSSFLQKTSNELTRNTNEQASSAEEVASSMQLMVSSIEENSRNSMETREVSVRAANDAENSQRSVLKTEQIMSLIGEKIEVINEIAFQVHILSLNTAIEAAHAGQYGAGFVTIAQEIRSLAEKSQKSANEILTLTAESIKVSQNSATALKNLAPKIINASELMSKVSDAGKEQTLGANQINSAIGNLNQVVQKNTTFAEQISAKASNLQAQVIELNQLVTIFKTE